MRVFITGDPHGDFNHIAEFCEKNNTTTDDVMIILGDAGINYYLDSRDYNLKTQLSKLPITFFCIHGNHEERPENISTYRLGLKHRIINGAVWVEPEFPNILFAHDNFTYGINGKSYYVLGGAYSVDKYYRIARGYKWYESEQNFNLMEFIEKGLDNNDDFIEQLNSFDNLTILTHTCPYKYVPTEAFLPFIDQSTVDNSMEYLLNKVEGKIKYGNWYIGHWHINKNVDNIHFLFHDIIEVTK